MCKCGQPEADAIWTSLLTASFPKALKGHWQHFTKTEKNVVGVDVLLKFLEDRILSTPLGSTPVAAPEPKQEPHRGQRQQFILPSPPSLSIDSTTSRSASYVTTVWELDIRLESAAVCPDVRSVPANTIPLSTGIKPFLLAQWKLQLLRSTPQSTSLLTMCQQPYSLAL